jgi:glycogen phosphorylase
MNENNANIVTFYVNPKIPKELAHLEELSCNLWSTWDKQAIKLFTRIDPIVYRKCAHNPVMLLHHVSADRLNELASDTGFLSELSLVYKSFSNYMKFIGHYVSSNGRKKKFEKDDCIAYFSMEYGLHESLPIYSGGLGILAGDHLKASSDQGIPLIGFGLLYQYGYFTQMINTDGEQQEEWKQNDWHLMPVKIMKTQKGDNMIVKINVEGQDILIKIWMISIGQTKLYLLDTDIVENSEFHRSITNKLYDSDRDIRILQEIVLSLGSLELLKELGIKPKAYHLNEGHSAFIIIERLRKLVKDDGFSFDEACQLVANSTVFTTHTPVTAGNEHFNIELVKKYLGKRIAETGLSVDDFFKYASIDGDDRNFWLPALALRFSRLTNAVSELHSTVSRKLWKSVYPKLSISEIPIKYVTNGVHTPTWLSKELTLLFDRYLGEDYLHTADESSVWENIRKIPDIEIWEAHQRRKEQMISFIRQRIEQSLLENKLSIPYSKKLRNTLSPDVLTVGFARRFAPYKRANLILEDKERLLAIINNTHKPVQFVFAGKAHPADPEGKKLIKNLVEFAKENDIEDRFVFIENYDINVAKHIVQGVDIWLNTPIRPFEASGTSGMKAGLNGVLNMSVLDGWWPECYDGENGWAITGGYDHTTQNISNHLESQQIYDLLEGEAADFYYRRNESNLPFSWLQRMKRSIYTVGMGFNLHRMLREYVDDFYIPCINGYEQLTADNHKLLHEILQKEQQIKEYWDRIEIKDCVFKMTKKDVLIANAASITSGDVIDAKCYVYLDKASEHDFSVEMIYRDLTHNKNKTATLAFKERYEDNVALYSAEFETESSGLHGINIRLKANNHRFHQNYYQYIKWER